MRPTARDVMHYHVFVASPGDVDEERQAVRSFFKTYNQSFAEPRGLSFDVVDWENYSTAGVGRPQELITQQTLERYRQSLVLVIGIMAQRFGSPSGTHESGTEEEFEWALRQAASGFPEIKWFFRDVTKLELDPADPLAGVAQWERVKAFRQRIETDKPVYARSYSSPAHFRVVLEQDLGRWLNDAGRPWFTPAASIPVDTAEWPVEVVEQLAHRLKDEFVRHMSGGEDISQHQARARYVHGLVRFRPLSRLTAGAETTTAVPDEGLLADFVAADGAQLLVLGRGGSGKTTLLKHLAAEGATRAARDRSEPIFVYARLTSFDRAEGGFEALLTLLSLAARIDRQEFEKRWRTGPRPIVFLLDGLNEVATAYQASCTRSIWTLFQGSFPRHRYVVTSRPGGELESMAAKSSDHHQLMVADLLEFGPEQVEEYLEAQGRLDLKETLSEPLWALASNPFLLWAITRTLSDSPQVKNRGTLFKALIDDYIFAKRERSKPAPRPTAYNYELVKQPILAALARGMIEQGVTEVDDGPELWQRIAKQLVDLERTHARVLPLESDTFMPQNYAATSLLQEIIDNGLLLREGGRLRFMHESVEEYFAAVAVRDSPVDDIAGKVGPLNLAYLDARGPAFETLVTWAGFAPKDAVTRLIERLRQSHPLLAAHLAVEAELPESQRQPLRQQFVSFAESKHEQRRRLGAMGLALIPSRDPDVVRCLVGMLDGEASETAKKVLRGMATSDVVAAIVNSWLTTHADVDVAHVDLLREMTFDHARVVAEVLLDAWNADVARRARVAALASALDARERRERQEPVFRQTLIVLSAEAELGGNHERSGTIDALRQAAEGAPAHAVGIKAAADRLLRRAGELNALLREKEKIIAEYAKQSDEALSTIIDSATATGVERMAALDTLVTRCANAAVRPAVERILKNMRVSRSEWLSAIASLPRDAVQSYLADRAQSDGEIAAYAGVLGALLADRPPRSTLESVLNDGSESLRAFAAQNAPRSGVEGVELLLTHLEKEASGDVLEAALKALGASGHELATARLLDLLFDTAQRSAWPDRHDELIRDDATGCSLGSDGWAAMMHDVLAEAGDEARILDRAERELASQENDRVSAAVDELRRWLPAARAAVLLRRAATHHDIDIRQRALWSLACAGDADAWQSLLEADLGAPPGFVMFAQDAARRLQAAPLDAPATERFRAASRAVLRPALSGADFSRRDVAIDLTVRLPDTWIDSQWRGDLLIMAERMIRHDDPDRRIRALRLISRFAEDANDRVFDHLLGDSDESVRRSARQLLGEQAADRLAERLQQAVAAADGGTARLMAIRLKELHASARERAICESSADVLESGTQDVWIAAVLVLTTLYAKDSEEVDFGELSRRARSALERHGVEDTWARFAVFGQSLPEEERGFIRVVVDAFVSQPEQYSSLVTRACQLWPDDLLMSACRVLMAINNEPPAAGAEAVQALETRFGDRINHTWLAERFMQVERYEDALRHYRLAVESDPDDAESHFSIGWLEFLDGDPIASIESTRRALELDPTSPMGEFNLGLALLAIDNVAAADAAYRRGVSLSRRGASSRARSILDDAIDDLARLAHGGTEPQVDRVRTWLRAERDRLAGD